VQYRTRQFHSFLSTVYSVTCKTSLVCFSITYCCSNNITWILGLNHSIRPRPLIRRSVRYVPIQILATTLFLSQWSNHVIDEGHIISSFVLLYVNWILFCWCFLQSEKVMARARPGFLYVWCGLWGGVRGGAPKFLSVWESVAFPQKVFTFDVQICRFWCILDSCTELGTSWWMSVFGVPYPTICHRFYAISARGPGGKWEY